MVADKRLKASPANAVQKQSSKNKEEKKPAKQRSKSGVGDIAQPNLFQLGLKGTLTLKSGATIVLDKNSILTAKRSPYTCDICGKPCQTSAALVSHKKTHSAEPQSIWPNGSPTNCQPLIDEF